MRRVLTCFLIIEDITPDKLNNTKNAEMDLLFFNRSPKVGSETLIALLQELGKLHNFAVHREPNSRYIYTTSSMKQQKAIIKHMMHMTKPSAYIHHVNYISFKALGAPIPIYINMVRDPVERVISWFYYARAPWAFLKNKMQFPEIPMPSSQYLQLDFETCVREHQQECTFILGSEHVQDHSRQTLFFCGHDWKKCIPFNGPYALQLAKRNVEQNYAVVGDWSETNITLTVLEHYIPKYFKNAKNVFYSNSQITSSNKNYFKPKVSDEIKSMVRANFSREIEFYEFCKQRLYKQYLALHIGGRFDEKPPEH